MREFLEKHGDKIDGTLSCFDRVLFRGYLPLMNGYDVVKFLHSRDVVRAALKSFVLAQANRIRQHGFDMAMKAGRPWQYLTGPARKEDLARSIAERDSIREGLVCIFSTVEPCRTFSIVWKERAPYIRPARRKCLFLYY